ncbi:MAG: bifunctional phosphoribosylaminoimidazolecarboxamide formyltransferase/IMP cyclohydrolase [Gemmatimonadetes bacterium]|nr:bifunctional phosphoribosylaminoimidazolecarboxamide formyltransferase/IMP cyclohydrolase [Gemmatimonadota bacterium]
MDSLPRALISVSDKRGAPEFARSLTDLGWEIISTGGTARALAQEGIKVTPVEAITGFPEMMDGRLKTLHPAVHGALLARRDLPDHMNALRAHGFAPIDLVAVNLYPFRETVATPRVRLEDAIEQIDIGGPALLRSAAKNHTAVLVVVDPSDYPRVLQALRSGDVTGELRHELAAKVFAHTAAYDSAIAAFLSQDREALPRFLGFALERLQTLRYGENPEQRAALYAVPGEKRGVADMVQLHGKELSFNNLLDIEGATAAVAPWTKEPACAIIKHTTPCGIALGPTAEVALRRALATDPVSAFGGVIALNTLVDGPVARAIGDLFVEVIVAPRFRDDALAVLKERKNLRIVEFPLDPGLPMFDVKRVRGGVLVQDRFVYSADNSTWKIVTKREPGEDEWRDLLFAWPAVASVKSNAILLAREEAAIGIGAGQMSRVDAVFLAIHKARAAGHDPQGAVLASDAFFPFPDGVEEAAKAGIRAIIQPGGSMRDADVIAAADAAGMAMVLTGRRQFRH